MPHIGDDKQWEIENDARTLAEAEAIKASRSRLSGARRAAKALAKEEQVKATALKKVAQNERY